ncbi:MAG: hypothetical protein AAF170_01225 [Bacteroidota bacterium]
MRLFCLLAVAVLPVLAQAQPFAVDAAPETIELATVPQPTALKVALVVEQAEESSCGDGVDCSDTDCSPSGSDCSDGGDGGAGCLIAGGCLVAAGGVGYLIYRWIQGRKPRPDSLASLNLTPAVRALADALAETATVTVGREAPSTADVVLTVREESASRHGVGLRSSARQLVIQASDGAGVPLTVSAGHLPASRVAIPVDRQLEHRARALLNELAGRRR